TANAVSRLTLKQTPDRDLVLERNGSPKTTFRREFRRPGLGPAERRWPGLPPVPRCQPPPTGWPSNGPKNRTSTEKTPIGRTVRPTSERLPRAGAEPEIGRATCRGRVEATGPSDLSGTKRNPESHM